jgi:hypothetical protein
MLKFKQRQQRVSGSRRGARVTFSSKISNCFKTELRSRWECSSTTRIFHLDGGLTERIASRNSAYEL